MFCGNSYRVELRKDENLKICKDEICRNSHKSGCNKFDFESVGTPTNLICKFNFEICGNYCKPGCNSSILKVWELLQIAILQLNFPYLKFPVQGVLVHYI